MNELDFAGLDLSGWEAFWQGLNTGGLFGGSLKEILSRLGDGSLFSQPGALLELLKEAALAASRQSFGAYGALIAVAVVCAVIGILSDGREGTSGAAGFLCFGMGAALVSYQMAALITLARDTIVKLASFMELAAPVLAVALAAAGGAATSAGISPLAAFLGSAVAGVFKSVVLPLAMACAVCAVLSVVTEKGKLEHLFSLLKSAIKWLSGAVFTVYFGMVTMQGLTVARTDSIALRTAKYTLDKSVPIIGGAMSGTLETVLSSAALVKNTVGAAALVTIVAIAAAPMLSIACSGLACKGVAAICEPMGETKIPALLGKASDVCNALFAVLTAVILMFMVTVGLALAAANP